MYVNTSLAYVQRSTLNRLLIALEICTSNGSGSKNHYTQVLRGGKNVLCTSTSHHDLDELCKWRGIALYTYYNTNFSSPLLVVNVFFRPIEHLVESDTYWCKKYCTHSCRPNATVPS